MPWSSAATDYILVTIFCYTVMRLVILSTRKHIHTDTQRLTDCMNTKHQLQPSQHYVYLTLSKRAAFYKQ